MATEYPLNYMQSLREVELSILRAISLGLHLDEDYLPNCHTAAANLLRLLHYPRCVAPLTHN